MIVCGSPDRRPWQCTDVLLQNLRRGCDGVKSAESPSWRYSLTGHQHSVKATCCAGGWCSVLFLYLWLGILGCQDLLCIFFFLISLFYSSSDFKILSKFMSTNIDNFILSHYTHRWKIEVMFKQHKMYMGLKSFMVRSVRAIDRLLIIFPLAHFFFVFGTGTPLSFSTGIRLVRGVLYNFWFCSFRVLKTAANLHTDTVEAAAVLVYFSFS